MRILLIAYEFPPSPSPQSLRWAYLVRELCALGHEVQVLAPDTPAYGGGLPSLPDGASVRRTYIGLIAGLPDWLARRRGEAAPSTPDRDSAPARSRQGSGPVTLNWKGRLYENIKRVLTYFLFPDIRGEWNLWAKRELAEILPAYRPDVVIASHEPANTLTLGLLAKSLGIPFVADLGDPVLASYTPRRWKARAFNLEAAVCARADHVVVTCMQAFELLSRRHGLARTKCTIVSQGFDSRANETADTRRAQDRQRPLTLLYTGSFYSFRRAASLLTAVAGTPGVVLEIASAAVPKYVLEASELHPDRIRLLGFMHHDQVLRRQRAADALVSIGNADSVQIPGKLYEYLGSGRPILQISGVERDPGKELVEGLRRGWACSDDERELAGQLASLVDAHRRGSLYEGLDLAASSVFQFSWQAQASKMNAALNLVAKRGA